MNYIIKITEENQVIVKRIANENGMNPYKFDFTNFGGNYYIENNIIVSCIYSYETQELTTKLFIEMFDKKVVYYIDSVDDIEVWNWFDKHFNFGERYNASTAMNWKYYMLACVGASPRFVSDTIDYMLTDPNTITVKLTLKEFKDRYMKPEQTEWKPKRGERVLVWDNNERDAIKGIFLAEIEGAAVPIMLVNNDNEVEFLNNQPFHTIKYRHMKQLPKEETIELTMDEIAAKFGIDVNYLKIKK